MKKGELFIRKHSSTILTIVGSIGVVVTSVLTAKATIKAVKLVEKERYRRQEYKTIFADNERFETVVMPDLTHAEILKIAWKPYIPAIISGVSTISCVFGANYLSRRSQASLMSAYALLDNTYREYREKTKELYPEETAKFEHKIINSKLKNIELEDDKELFYDYQSMRDFQSTFEDVKNAEYLLNQKLSKDGFACLNDFYDFLGISHVPYGYQLGWSTIGSDEVYGRTPLRLEFDKAVMDDGLECNIMSIKCSPLLEYICC